MADVIDIAKSGRATCRVCKSKIEKDALRFGQEVTTQFSTEPSMQWYHLPCAAKKLPTELKAALETYDGEVPDRDSLEKTIEASKGTEKPSTLPYADRAPTGRAKCMQCSEPIAKDALRVAVEREVATGSFGAKSAGYLHPPCVNAYNAAHASSASAELRPMIEKHSRLPPGDLKEVLDHIA